MVVDLSYQVAILGKPTSAAAALRTDLTSALSELGLGLRNFRLLGESDLWTRERRAPFVAVFFGYDGASANEHLELKPLLDDSVPIIPVVDDLDGYRAKVPTSLEGVNGLSLPERTHMPQLVSAVLENLSLLRAERRLFISYRRAESSAAAIQMFEALDSRGFNVFLDTHSVRPAAHVQSELWQRLADSDIVLLLDTPNFRVSRWTVAELAQANMTSIQILHVLWPTVHEDPYSAFSSFYETSNNSFRSGIAPDQASTFSDETVDDLCLRVEALRARALAARYTYMVDYFCDQARAAGRDVYVHPQRYLSVEGPGRSMAVFPTVGIPTARRLEEVEIAISKVGVDADVRVIYDERGIMDVWRVHLDWLSSHLPVRAIQVRRLPEAFKMGELG